MKKNFLKFLYSLFNKTGVRIALYVAMIVVIFGIYGVFSDIHDSVLLIFGRILSIFQSEETLSVFFVGIFSIFVATLVRKFDYWLEESFKIEDDHHKIIHAYSGHPTDASQKEESFADKNGVFMSLKDIKFFGLRFLKNKEKDSYSKSYQTYKDEIDVFKEGTLYLPSLNVFANIKGDTNITFRDQNVAFEPPRYIIQNAAHLMAAHKHSKTSNNRTIRLNDFTYKNHTLTLDTMRSTYYHMLMTNRCMDFEFQEGLSLRKIYEYKKEITPLSESVFGNQIGINGLILTKDGYVLIEKRDHNKTTWKNKFAQSISLALKESELMLDENHTIGSSKDAAAENLKHVIAKTLKGNFGLTENDLAKTNMRTSFLGLARDLLEGGKPNLYFYVTADCPAEELAQRLAVNASKIDENAFQTDKLSSDYYLVPFKDLAINFNYVLKIDRRKCYWIKRRVHPRTNIFRCFLESLRRTFAVLLNPTLKRECGEALLVTLSYLELCKDRIEALQEQ